MKRAFEFMGTVSLFALQVLANLFRLPLEVEEIWRQVGEMGVRSLPLVAASGLALGVVMTLHTRSTLITFGAQAMIPKKRAGLARALVFEPQILLIDEPSSGLDRITASEIDDLLLKQKTKQQTTMVIVTHDVHSARRVGDRFAVLDQGRLAALGTPQELKSNENETVRRLIAEQ